MRYVVLVLLLVILLMNFSMKGLAKRIFKKDLSIEQEVAAKSVCFIAVLAGVVYIIFFG